MSVTDEWLSDDFNFFALDLLSTNSTVIEGTVLFLLASRVCLGIGETIRTAWRLGKRTF